MQPPPPTLSSFKYRHNDPGAIGRARLVAAGVTALAAPISFYIALPLGIVLTLVALVLFFAREKVVRVGPRYVLCGNTLIYYAQVSRVDYLESSGQLCLQTHGGQRLVLERDKFPTKARKPHKVAANRAAKFVKVSGKIVEKVRATAPNAEIHGTVRALP